MGSTQSTWGHFILSHNMKVFALCLLFVVLAFADDSNVPCTTPMTGAVPAGLTCVQVDGINAWAAISVNNTQTQACAQYTYTLFVIAVRPGEDATGNFTQYMTQAGSGGNYVAGTCVQIQAGQEDDDMDYGCVASPYNSTTTLTIYSVPPAAGVAANSTAFEVYAGFAEGSTTDCASSLVSSSGGIATWVWVLIGVVAVVVVVGIIAAIGGFFYMKRKKDSYQLYEDA